MKTPERSNKVYLSENKAVICVRIKSIDQKSILYLLFLFSFNSVWAVIKLKEMMKLIIKFVRNDIVKKTMLS